MTKKPTIICFDLGGVLVRICRSFREATLRAELPLRDAEWLDSPPALTARREVIFAYQCGALSTSEYLEQMSATLRGSYSPDEVLRIHDAWLLEEYPGARHLIEELNAVVGVRTVCLSNTNERHWTALASRPETAGATPSFPSVIALQQRFASHLMRSSKPDPRIFRALQQALEAAPDEILFFDDLGENVRAARQAGWRAESIDHCGDTTAQIRGLLAQHGLFEERLT